jgi:ATPase family AAA domain-containing protein 3A/B
VESINVVFSNLGRAAVDLLSDTNKLATTVAALTALAAGIYGSREATRVVGRVVERWLGTPKLVREEFQDFTSTALMY